MGGGQLAVDTVKRVSDGVRKRLLLQEGLKVENVVAKAADLGVLRLRKTPDKEVNLARILRKISRTCSLKKVSGNDEIARHPSMVSWSVMVTKSIPAALAR